MLGPDALVERSAAVDEALEAVHHGTDYLEIWAVFTTPTRPEGDVAELDLVREISRLGLPIPWFAIGGATLETAPEAAARELRSHFPG